KGFLDFTDRDNVVLNFSGKVEETADTVKIDGLMNAYTGQYDIEFKALNLDADKWGFYVMPLADYNISTDKTTVSGRIKSKDPYPLKDIPFWYDLRFDFHKSKFKMPFFERTVDNVDGVIRLSYGIFSSTDFKSIIKKKQTFARKNNIDTDKIFEELVQNKIIDKKGRLNTVVNPEKKYINLRLSKYISKFEKDIIEVLANPLTMLYLHDIRGDFYDIPIISSGFFNLAESRLSIFINSDIFALEKIKEIFPALNLWKISGAGDTQLRITGSLDRPYTAGFLRSERAEFYAFKPENVIMNYDYYDQHLKLKLTKGELYSGYINGRAELDFNEAPPGLRMNFKGSDFQLNRVFPDAKDYVSGNCFIDMVTSGNVKKYFSKLVLTGQELILNNQEINSSTVNFSVANSKDIDIYKSNIKINNGLNKLVFSGKIKDLIDTELVFRGKSLVFKDLDRGAVSTGNMLVKGELSTRLITNFWKKPLDEIKCSINCILQDYELYGHFFEQLNTDFVYDKHDIALNKFSGSYEDEKVDIRGYFKNQTPENLKISLKNYNLTYSSLIRKFFPEEVQPFGGKATFKATILKNSGNNVHKQKIKYWNWLQKYSIDGTAVLEDGFFQGQPFKSISLKSNWNGNNLSIEKFEVAQESSNFSFSGGINLQKDLNIAIHKGSFIDFNDFPILLASYGNIAGKVDINGTIKGKWPGPGIDVFFEGWGIYSDFLRLDDIAGHIIYDKNKWMFDSLVIKQKADDYKLNGYVDLSKYKDNKSAVFDDIDFELSFNTVNGNLVTLINIIEALNKEVSSRSIVRFEIKDEKVTNANSKIEVKREYMLKDQSFDVAGPVPLFSRTRSDTSLDYFLEVLKQQSLLEKPPDLGLRHLFKGNFSGSIYAKSRYKKTPLIKADLRFNQVEMAWLKAGKAHFGIYPGKSYMAIGLVLDDGKIGNKPFKNITLAGRLSDTGFLNMKRSEIQANGKYHSNIVSGKVPVSVLWDKNRADETMDLKIKLRGDELGLLSYIIPYVNDVNNKGQVYLKLNGTVDKPVLNSEYIKLKDTYVHFTDEFLIQSPIRIIGKNIEINNNKISFSDIKAEWRGVDTKKKHTDTKILNEMDLTGSLILSGLNFIKPEKIDIGMNMSIKDTDLTVNLPAIYHGDVSIGSCSIKGLYSIPLSSKAKTAYKESLATIHEKGPLISANIKLSNGEIVLPGLGKRKSKPTFLLNLNGKLGKDVTVAGSLFGSGTLADIANNFDLRLNETKEDLLVTGTLNAAKIKNSVVFLDGFVNLLNFSFELIPPEDQGIFYQEEYTEVKKDNTLSFVTKQIDNSEKMRLEPVFEIRALSIIEPPERVTKNALPEPYKYVVMSVDGSMYNLEKIVVAEYEGMEAQPQGKLKPENIYYLSGKPGAAYEDSTRDTLEVVKLIMPDLIPEGEDQDTQRLITDIGENQLNILLRRNLLRPIERQMKKTMSFMGLYDMKVDYNLGSALMRGTGVSGQDDNIDKQDVLGLDMIYNMLSDRVFLRIKTDIDMSSESRGQTNTFHLSEWELTWYVWRNLSMNYAQISDDDTGKYYRPRFSLKYSYEF
ncbi:MAG: hypothetical protein GY730_03280, partial [bacterium]|nr:hypothetical protein [bacterium]